MTVSLSFLPPNTRQNFINEDFANEFPREIIPGQAQVGKINKSYEKELG
jgi:hypothetical protein